MAYINISLENGDIARNFDKEEERLQSKSYNEVVRFLKDSLKILDKSERGEAKDSNQRVHDAIFINGQRGTGKTAFILSLKNAFNQQHDKGFRQKLYFCRPIDPTLMEEKENFLNTILGQLHAEVVTALNKYERPQDYYVALENVANALSSIDGAHNLTGMERILANKSGIGLFDDIVKFYEESCKILNCDAIVLLIDDVDMALSHAFQILDVIRRYLASPRIIPVLTGDLDMYRHILSEHFHKELEGAVKAEDGVAIKDLPEQYLAKVLPTHRRTRLLNVAEILDQHVIQVPLGTEGREVRFQDYYNFIKHLIYRHTNGVEGSHPDFRPTTARNLVQFLLRTAPSVAQVEDLLRLRDKGQELPANEVENKVRSIAIHTAKDKKLYAEILTALNDYWASTENWAAFHRGQADMRLLHMTADANVRPLMDLVLFNPLRHPPYQSTYNWSEVVENTFKRAGNSLPRPLGNTLLSMPSLEPYSRDAIFAKNDVKKITSRERLIVAIFGHGDYYSSYQTTHLIFFGRAWEIVINSIFGLCTESMLRSILKSPPYMSYFHAFPTKTLDSGEEEDMEVVEEVELDLKPFAKEISAWYHQYIEEGPRISAQLIYKATNKLFTALNQVKVDGRLLGNELDDVPERFRRIALNSFASFEKNILDGGATVVLQNTAQFKKLGDENKDASYRANVLKLVAAKKIITNRSGDNADSNEEKVHDKVGDVDLSFTEMLLEHPLFKYIHREDREGRSDVVVKSLNRNMTKSLMETKNLMETKKKITKLLMDYRKKRKDNPSASSAEFIESLVDSVLNDPDVKSHRGEFSKTKANPLYKVCEIAKEAGMGDRFNGWFKL